MKPTYIALFSFLTVTLTLSLMAPAYGAAPVEAVALFKDRAVVRTLAGEQMLKVGETSEHGVTLLDAGPTGATVRFRGEIYNLDLSTRVGSSFAERTVDAVRINQDNQGQYRVRGAIDGHYVNFLVDTGASVVAMSQRHADGMGLNYLSGQVGKVQTAQGNANAYFVLLDEITVGEIKVHKVKATVIEGIYPVDVLLGMTFLKEVQMQDTEGVLTLTAKF